MVTLSLTVTTIIIMIVVVVIIMYFGRITRNKNLK